MIKKSLCDICTPKQWKTVSSDMLTKTGYPVYGANGIIGYYTEYNHEKQTLLITCRGATCGTLNICESFSYVNGNAMALDNLSDEVDLSYLFYYLSARGLSDTITGSAQPQIVRQSLKKVKINYPHLDEQCKIAAVLDKVSDLITKRREQLDKLDLLVKSKFIEMFGNPAMNTLGLPKVRLKECLTGIENGKSFVCATNPRQGDKPAILKLSAATYGEYNPKENKAILDDKMFVEEAEVHVGDLLFTRKNTPELVGICAYVSETPPNLMMSDLIFRLNTSANCNKIFLWKLINHDLFRDKISQIATGSAKSMSNISKERLGNLEIILPSLESQNEFAVFVSKIEKSKIVIQRSLEKLETLKKSLMQQYFG